MKEIEILVQVFSDKKIVLGKLNKFKHEGIKLTKDTYFYDPNKNNLKPENGRLRECFRLRNKGGKFFMAHKVDHFEKGDIWTHSDEYETEVKDFDNTLKIIEHLGLKKLIEINNEKRVFLTEEFEIVLEDVEDLGLFLEVESLNPSENIKKEKEKIWAFIKALNIKTSTELNAGKPELMLKKKGMIK